MTNKKFELAKAIAVMGGINLPASLFVLCNGINDFVWGGETGGA